MHRAGETLLLCGARELPRELLSRSDFLRHVGEENVLPHIQQALERAREIRSSFSGVGRELALDLEHRPL